MLSSESLVVKLNDLTERVYTRRTVEWLISELDKIP